MIYNNYAAFFNQFHNATPGFKGDNKVPKLNIAWYNAKTPDDLFGQICMLKKGGAVQRVISLAAFLLLKKPSDANLKKLTQYFVAQINKLPLNGADATARKKIQQLYAQVQAPVKAKAKQPVKPAKKAHQQVKAQKAVPKAAPKVVPPPRKAPTPPASSSFVSFKAYFAQFSHLSAAKSADEIVTTIQKTDVGHEEATLSDLCTTLLNKNGSAVSQLRDIIAALLTAINTTTTRINRSSWNALVTKMAEWYTTFKNRHTRFSDGKILQMALVVAHLESQAEQVHAIANNFFQAQSITGTEVVAICEPHRVQVIFPETILGSGAFKTVYKADKVSRNALKQLTCEPVAFAQMQSAGRADALAEFTTARAFSKSQDHVQYYTLAEDVSDGVCSMVEELCDGTLENVTSGRTRTTTYQKFQLCKNFLIAMRKLEEGNFLHNDIKKENVLLKDLKPKITDFGKTERVPALGAFPSNISFFYGTPACGDINLFASWNGSNYVKRTTRFNGDYSKIEKHACGNLLYEVLYGQAPEWCTHMSHMYLSYQRRNNGADIAADDMNSYGTALTHWRSSRTAIALKYSLGGQLTDREAIDYLIYCLIDPDMDIRATAALGVQICEIIEGRGIVKT